MIPYSPFILDRSFFRQRELMMKRRVWLIALMVCLTGSMKA